jgi:hypothetical protein
MINNNPTEEDMKVNSLAMTAQEIEEANKYLDINIVITDFGRELVDLVNVLRALKATEHVIEATVISCAAARR